MKRTIILVSSFMLLVPFCAAKGFEISADAGVIGLGLNNKWDTNLTIGATGSIPLTDRITAEAEFFYYLSSIKKPELAGIEFSSSAWDLNLYGLYHFAKRNLKIKPYAALGGGILSSYARWTVIGRTDSYRETKFDIGVGGGVKYPFGKRSGLRFDVRYIVIFGIKGDLARISAGYYIKLK